MRVFFNFHRRLSSPRVKREKTLDDSQEKFEQVQIRRERTRVAESTGEFQAKREREFELLSSFGPGPKTFDSIEL